MEWKPSGNDANDWREKPWLEPLLALWLYQYQQTMMMPAGDHVSDDKIRAYAFVLRDVPQGVLERTLKLLASECERFPTAVEILDRARDGLTEDEIRLARRQVDDARARFLRGENAPQLESLTRETVKQLAGEVLSRHELLKLKLVEPRPNPSPEAMLQELLKQTEGLLEHVRAKAERVPCTCYRCRVGGFHDGAT